ncbi:uncharacterized protein C10orf67, mitochondrial-like [Myotis daubentonii]|uniref:uncharacterized protein C10orf67, mitochondrial-like n=1 Tax=Myotis daubentonii TaxID=98922 RepID=UPI002873BB67|nr:uncharacterized protein C10orf67, mitochondrial-like [Myotis daubentonii]
MVSKHKEEMEMRKKWDIVSDKGSRSLKGKELTFSPWSSQHRIKPSSFPSTSGSKTKRGKTSRKSLKQKHSEVRPAPVATSCDTFFCTGAPVLLAIAKPQSYLTPSINKAASLNTPDSPDSLHTSGQGLWVLFSAPVCLC